MTDDTLRLACELALAARRRAARRRRRSSRAAPADRPPPRRSPAQRKGDHHEDAALRLLQSRGLVLLARNLQTRAGEIDLAMRDGDTLVFVEVRSRELARRHWRGRLPAARFDAVVFDAGDPQWLRGAFWQA